MSGKLAVPCCNSIVTVLSIITRKSCHMVVTVTVQLTLSFSLIRKPLFLTYILEK